LLQEGEKVEGLVLSMDVQHLSYLGHQLLKADRQKAHLTLMFALPMSPDVENLMPSFVTDIKTESPMVARSLLKPVTLVNEVSAAEICTHGSSIYKELPAQHSYQTSHPR